MISVTWDTENTPICPLALTVNDTVPYAIFCINSPTSQHVTYLVLSAPLHFPLIWRWKLACYHWCQLALLEQTQILSEVGQGQLSQVKGQVRPGHGCWTGSLVSHLADLCPSWSEGTDGQCQVQFRSTCLVGKCQTQAVSNGFGSVDQCLHPWH